MSYELRKDEEMLLVIANSHGTQAQNNGFFAVTRRGCAALMQLRQGNVEMTTVAGYSDMEAARPRNVDWSKHSIFHPFDRP
jgi:hypothetical protein